ncbi:MAG: DUF1844 domain-containing protein [Planctomycetota bacterium]|jgi:hypothetical protein
MVDNEEAGTEKRIDEGWKRKAREEKEALEKEGAAPDTSREGAAGDERAAGEAVLPPATFVGLVSGLAAQAFAFLGLVGEGESEKEKDLDAARHLLDTLAMLQEKTKGNLTDDESAYLEGLLYNLRMAYVKQST